MTVLTPVEIHKGLWMKREDLHRYPNGANGAKLRAAETLLDMAYDAGYREVVTGAACVSPQHALVASAAARRGMRTIHVIGGTTPEARGRHTSVRLAEEAGAEFEHISVGYNPALVARCRYIASALPAPYWLHYGISAPPEASRVDLIRFHDSSASQVNNLPSSVTDIVLPFGSGNTGAGVLWGLEKTNWHGTVHLMAIGPDRLPWLEERLKKVIGGPLSWSLVDLPFRIDLHTLHNRWAKYGDRMPETVDGVVMHPTYEGKIVRYLNTIGPSWWTRPDDRTLLWIVGAPLPRLKGSVS